MKPIPIIFDMPSYATPDVFAQCEHCHGQGYVLIPTHTSIFPKATVFIIERCPYHNHSVNFPAAPGPDITILPGDDPNKQHLGWVIYEEVGIVVVNDYAISKIEV